MDPVCFVPVVSLLQFHFGCLSVLLATITQSRKFSVPFLFWIGITLALIPSPLIVEITEVIKAKEREHFLAVITKQLLMVRRMG